MGALCSGHAILLVLLVLSWMQLGQSHNTRTGQKLLTMVDECLTVALAVSGPAVCTEYISWVRNCEHCSSRSSPLQAWILMMFAGMFCYGANLANRGLYRIACFLVT